MPGLGAGHWGYILILLVVVLIIWGPGKLPDIGAGLGRGIREFRKATSETRDEFSKATRGDDATQPAAPAPAPAYATPTAAAQPAPVGGGTPNPAPAERAAGDGDHTTAV